MSPFCGRGVIRALAVFLDAVLFHFNIALD